MRGARRLAGVVVGAAVALSAASALADNDPWPVARARLSYSIYKPLKTFGYKVSSFGYQPCPGGPSKASVYSTFGSYKGLLESKTKGFGLLEGSPRICSDHAEFTGHGKVQIGADKATLGVYCDVPRTCSISKGRTNGFILLWRRGKTTLQMDSAHLPLAQFLAIARSLTRVR